jgi:isocitrate dehydrogenase
MSKPTKHVSLAQKEIINKYYDGNWDDRRKSLKEDVYRQKVNNPSGPKSTVKKRYISYSDDADEIVLMLREL